MDQRAPHIRFSSPESSNNTRPPPEPSPDYTNVSERRPPPLKPASPARRRVAFQAKDSPRIHRDNSVAEDQQNLAHTENLNEATILRLLEERFRCDIAQTYIGDVLVIVNPYKPIDIYGDERDQDPHLYWFADHAYRRMIDTTSKQCILVNGESGAGKTEATKSLLKHLVYVSESSVADLHERIIKVNPILEAFGNAQTAMNHNSSRFGKFIEVMFRIDGHLTGACIHDYLLEKSRVVHLGPNERNFHVFYYMFAGMPKDTLRYYYLEDPMAHRILRCEGGAKSVFHSIEDKERCQRMFDEMESELYTVGFHADDFATVYTCLAAVLFITNIQFRQDDDSDGTYIIDEYPVSIGAILNLPHDIRVTGLFLQPPPVSTPASLGDVLYYSHHLSPLLHHSVMFSTIATTCLHSCITR
ncbi:Myosin-IIIb [Lamellibrachia satsuma]|nr:Myosin-IIIb [Lamellibrachia satsuma]